MEKREEKVKEKTEKALFNVLRPEFINRIDEIITFRHLDKNDFKKIAELFLSRLKSFMSEKGTKLAYDDAVLEFIAEESYSEKFGARNMRRFIEKAVEDKIASIVVDNNGKNLVGISLSLKDGEISVDAI